MTALAVRSFLVGAAAGLVFFGGVVAGLAIAEAVRP